MKHAEEWADQVRCPACHSHRIACSVDQMFDLCLKCLKVWERMPAGEPFTRDGEMMAFKVPCDNCAFRGQSAERMDPERWNELQLSLAYGAGMFFCHKGVPASAAHIGATGILEFEFPQIKKTVDIAGGCHPYSTFDTSRMRLCRGYLNQHVGPKMRHLGLVPEPLMTITPEGECNADV